MLVKWRLDPKVVWRLSEIAELRGVSIEEVVNSLLGMQNSGHKGRVSVEQSEVTKARIAELHGEGFTDSEIGVRIDRVPAHVARVRRGLGLVVNKRRKPV